jgi:hypothetical protein
MFIYNVEKASQSIGYAPFDEYVYTLCELTILTDTNAIVGQLIVRFLLYLPVHVTTGDLMQEKHNDLYVWLVFSKIQYVNMSS